MPNLSPLLSKAVSGVAGIVTVAWHLTSCLCAQENELLPLPAWSEQDAALLQQTGDPFPLGGVLWPDGFKPQDILPPALDSSSNVLSNIQGRMTAPGTDSSAAGFRSERFLLFIPKQPSPVAGSSREAPVTPAHALVEISEDFLRDCESLEPDACLLDPHVLLPETQSEDLRRLLTYHAGEARTFANFLILDSHEKLPAHADLSRLAQGHLVQEHTCLAAYPLGEPWRARLFMTREIAQAVSPDYLSGILTACVQDALQASDSVEQLQRFATQLSIRLIWLERAHPALFTIPDDTSTSSTATPDIQPVTLTDVTVPASNMVPPTPPASPLRWQKAAVISAWALGALLLLATAVIMVRRWLRRRRRNSVWLLPESDFRPRLGAPHCGHGGAWIRYG